MNGVLLTIGLAWGMQLLTLQGAPELAQTNWWPMAELLGAFWLVQRANRPGVGTSSKVVDLKAYRQNRHAEKKPSPPWISLFVSQDATKVALLSSLLESESIEYQVSGQHTSTLFGPIAALPMEILVRPEEWERAQVLARKFEDPPQT